MVDQGSASDRHFRKTESMPLPDRSLHSDQSLGAAANLVVGTADPLKKADFAFKAAEEWFARRLGKGSSHERGRLPDRPARPEKPLLLPPSRMPRRSANSLSGEGKIALLHSLAHIELNAIDLTWDLVARFIDAPVPRSFFDDFVQVGLEEAKHYRLLHKRLGELGAAYGDMPAHDGLWQAAESTGHDLTARLAIIPMVLEARGLDVTPSMTDKMRQAGDEASAEILGVIYNDEKRHVAFGTKWFRFLCDRERVRPEPRFQEIVRATFRGALKPPFNDRARAEAGLTPGFYKPLSRLIGG